jgi:hypothetical protein
MIRRPHRVNFRLSDVEKARYAAMIGQLLYVNNWTDLCLKGLEELYMQFTSPKTPLGTSPWPSDNRRQSSDESTGSRPTLDRLSDTPRPKKARAHRYKDESGRVIRRAAGKKRKKVLASKNGKH